MSWRYRPDEVFLCAGVGAPTAASTDTGPILYVDLATGQLYLNKTGAANAWVAQGTGNIETLAAARVLTMGDSGKTFFLNLAGGFDVTLPATATSAGFTACFIVKTAPTTAVTITGAAGASSDDIIGWPANVGGADSVADGSADGDVITFAANVALPGDYAEITCDGAKWYVKAYSKTIHGITITG